MDGGMDGWMDEWMDRYIDGQIDRKIDLPSIKKARGKRVNNITGCKWYTVSTGFDKSD